MRWLREISPDAYGYGTVSGVVTGGARLYAAGLAVAPAAVFDVSPEVLIDASPIMVVSVTLQRGTFVVELSGCGFTRTVNRSPPFPSVENSI